MNLFTVAEHTFEIRFTAISEESSMPLLDNYVPFKTSVHNGHLIFSLEIASENIALNIKEETRQTDDGQEILCGKTPDENYAFVFFCGNQKAGSLVCSKNFEKGHLYISNSQNFRLKKFAIDNALMVMYALATADKQTVLFHASVIKNRGKGYMFLGQSGTGKSTHAGLWLKHIEGSELLNDDNPVVRFTADGFYVYGSPWSGKTACYKNDCARLNAIIDLSQAPYNKIQSLQGIEAYIALMVSISGMRWHKQVADGLHETQSNLAKQVQMFHLECLPDKEAALTCFNAVMQSPEGCH